MKTNKLLVAAVAAFSSVAVFAADDITPSRYIFANQAVGQYAIEHVVRGANPPAGWSVVTDGYNNGFLFIDGGPGVGYTTGLLSLEANHNARYIQEGLNIVDLGGTIGKVLCLRGQESTLEHGAKMNAAWPGNWFDLNFVLDPTETPKGEGTSFRVRLVYNVYHNTPAVGHKVLDKHFLSTFQNSAPDNAATSALANDTQTFVTIDEDTEEQTYDITKWVAREIDFTVPEVSGNPARIKLGFLASAKAGTVFIKEIKVTKNNTTPVVEQALLSFQPGTTSLNDVTLKNLSIAVIGNELHLQEVALGTPVSVYTSLGQQVVNVAYKGNAIVLDKGIYIVRAGAKTAKVVVR